MSHLELLELELQDFQIELPHPERLALATYCDELARWNNKINLTALSGAALVRRLVVEPVWIARQLEQEGSLADIGSGNGSPAIPFQIVRPFQTCHLIEARAKRVAFLRHVTTKLRLAEVKVHRARFEDVISSSILSNALTTSAPLGRPDWVSLQAVNLSEKIVDAIRLIASPTTTIVWITAAGAHSSLKPHRSLTVPFTGTRVFLFHLDLP